MLLGCRFLSPSFEAGELLELVVLAVSGFSRALLHFNTRSNGPAASMAWENLTRPTAVSQLMVLRVAMKAEPWLVFLQSMLRERISATHPSPSPPQSEGRLMRQKLPESQHQAVDER